MNTNNLLFDFNHLDDTNKHLNEMAEIGTFKAKKSNFTIFIWSRDPRYIPHIHIGDANTYPECINFQTCLKIESPEYFDHGGKYTDKFNAKQIDQLIEFLNEEYAFGITNWQYVLLTWNKNTSKIKVDLNQEIPDYTLLKNKK